MTSRKRVRNNLDPTENIGQADAAVEKHCRADVLTSSLTSVRPLSHQPLQPRSLNTVRSALVASSIRDGKLGQGAALLDNCSSNTSARNSEDVSSSTVLLRGEPAGGARQRRLEGPPSRPRKDHPRRPTMSVSSAGDRASSSARSRRAVVTAGGIGSTVVGKKKAPTATGSSQDPTSDAGDGGEMQRRSVWRSKREELEDELCFLTRYTQQLTEETEVAEDVIEGMLTEWEEGKRKVLARQKKMVTLYEDIMGALRAREDACLASKQRALDRIKNSQVAVCQLQSDQEAAQEATVLVMDERRDLERQLVRVEATAVERGAALKELQEEETRMKESAYGLSGVVKEMVEEMERLRKEKHHLEVQSMQAEMARRELYALCEELKGSIRVYCRVKGIASSSIAPSATAGASSCVDEVAKVQQHSEKQQVDEVAGSTSKETDAPLSPLQSYRESKSRADILVPVLPDTVQDDVVGELVESSTLDKSLRGGSPALLPSLTGGHAKGLTSAKRSSRSQVHPSVSMPSVRDDKENPILSCTDDMRAPLFSFPDRPACAAADTAVATWLADESKSEQRPCNAKSLPEPLQATALNLDVSGVCPSSTSIVEEDHEASDIGLPYGMGRSITVHQTRSNATSTGLNSFTETFTFDRVFTAEAQQKEIYRDVEPLVRSAVDGYRVCIFAYGQTGSGKTYTMEGEMRGASERYGVTPRALQTVLQRQTELAREGWTYELSCTFIEIYNDVIRDLFQSGSSQYEAALQQQPPPPSSHCALPSSFASSSSSSSTYHTIKHTGDCTHITNITEHRIDSMDSFLGLYRRAILQRSTAKTDLNDTSSRSHCVFTLHIVGTNATIRQRSDGVLCLIDLAGSERVNESGVQGKQFKEMVNINRSLLDLSKCIRALRSGAVVPWRNSKLTYLLQNHLGAKGGKMLMIVTVSNAKAHVPETLNSLRFAARVQETYVGSSVKRVTSMDP